MKFFRALIKKIDQIDYKLVNLSCVLMAKKMKLDGPMHPKNVLKVKSSKRIWFCDYLPSKGSQVLDLGAGSGSVSFIVAARGANVIAFEKSIQNIKIIKAQLEKNTYSGQITIEQRDLEDFPYPVEDNAFDVVICTDVLEHLNKRTECIKEMYRCLKPGGRLVLAVPKVDTFYKKVKKKLDLPYYSDEDHKIEYTRKSLIAEIKTGGDFKLIHESTIVYDFPIHGLIDIIGPVSLKAYALGVSLKRKLARIFPEQSNGFQMVFEKLRVDSSI